MSTRCPVCLRPTRGNTTGDERPCQLEGSVYCWERGYERRGLELGDLRAELGELRGEWQLSKTRLARVEQMLMDALGLRPAEFAEMLAKGDG